MDTRLFVHYSNVFVGLNRTRLLCMHYSNVFVGLNGTRLLCMHYSNVFGFETLHGGSINNNNKLQHL